VISPLDGKITAVAAPLGTFVQADTELFRIADPRFVQVEAAVTAVDATHIAVGDAAKITLPSGATISATVRSITPLVDQQTRTATVVLSLMPNHEPLSLGEVVSADITPRNVSRAGVVVPEEAVQNVGGRNVVFVRTPNGFQIRPVAVGSRSGGRVSITSGLNAGETIATTNAFFLKAEIGKGAGGDE
jgi:membrane fusion protein, heavy metal efflux system